MAKNSLHLKKIKTIRDNHKPYISKTFRLAIMKRCQWKIKANKTEPSSNTENYKKQRKLLRHQMKHKLKIFK